MVLAIDRVTDGKLTVREVAEILDLTEEHIRRLIRQGKIPAIKIRGFLITKEDLQSFIESRRVGTKER